MKNEIKETQQLNMPWEKEYGYAQDVRKGNTVWLAGQLGHDENEMLADDMESQVRLSYGNIKKLLTAFNMSMDDVVEEVLYVLDMPTALEASKKIRPQFYQQPCEVATTIVSVNGLALPGQLIEIKIVAKR